jgi:hypothetical protein
MANDEKNTNLEDETGDNEHEVINIWGDYTGPPAVARGMKGLPLRAS